jgi:hypothetical protein
MVAMMKGQLLIDLNVVLSERDDGFARAGAAIVRHCSVPDPQLQLLEMRYPREVARARFQAIHTAVIESWNADPVTIGRHFRAALIEAFKRLGRFSDPGLIRIDRESAAPSWQRPAHTAQV